MMALHLDIYRSDWNDSANIFHGREYITVVNIPGPFEPQPSDAVALLEQHAPGACRLVPAELIGSEWIPLEGMTNGGTYAATSDSRFNETMRELLGSNFYGAVAVHDRLHWSYEAASYE
jgi:hypothetical protein